MVDFGLDEFVDDVAAPAAAPRAERELLPEGVHEFQIRQVGYLEDGRLEIRLVPDDKAYGWIFAKFPTEADWAKRILSGLRKALAIPREVWAAMDMTDLVDRRVRARIYHAHKGGRTFANVGEFFAIDELAQEAAAAKAPAKPTARRTPTQKADAAAAMPDDDIPF